MIKKWRVALITIFTGMVFLGVFTIHSIMKVHSYGEVINYVGIIRGGTQRLIKLELAGNPNDELIVYLDDILDNLTTGEGAYGLVQLPDHEYTEKLSSLNKQWKIIKQEIKSLRENPQNRKTLLEDSETYFVNANQTVFFAQDYASAETSKLTVMITVLFIGMLVAWMFLFRDNAKKILHLESKNKDLYDLVDRDTLTNAYMIDAFKRIAQRYINENKNLHYAVLYADFEDFKYINDVFGYAYGDEILKKYAAFIQEDLHTDEIFGRVHADHFVILKTYQNESELLERQKSLDNRITEFMRNSHSKHALLITCGVCCLVDLDEELKIEGFIDRANFARKTVKQGKYKNYAFYNESIRQHLWEENSLRSNIETAFHQHEFIVYYQPKVRLCDEKIVSAEALVRWKQADGTIIAPDKFIPILEKDRNIAKLDRYVMEEVCHWLRQRLDKGLHVFPVSVNVSRIQFYNSDFISVYSQIRDAYQIPHHLLEIEFTESIAFDNTPMFIKIVKDLKKSGFLCSIDDFGKGYSSLGLLKSLPVDTLKFDSLFFTNIEDAGKTSLIVEGMIAIMKKLDITTVAEGIENNDQVAFLKRINCDIIQGYYYYRPMKTEDYEQLLDRMVVTN